MNNIYGIHEQALQLKSARAEILANNLINSSTPGFKARDIDFHKMLQEEIANNQSSPTSTNINSVQSKLQYRIPVQNTTNGNTVETDVEQMLYAENALEYKATLSFMKHRTNQILQAIRGAE